MKKYFWFILIIFAPYAGYTQEVSTYSLSEAIAYAKEHNYDYINAQTDIEIAEQQVWESTAMGLPQLDASIKNDNYINIPVTLMPDFISPSVYNVNINDFGLTPHNPLPEDPQYFPVKFGTKHTANASVNVNQLLFSGEYIVALKASKTFLGQTERQKVQTELLLIEQVSKSYFLILSLHDNLKILDSSLVVNEKLFEDTKAMYQVGFAEDTDSDQLEMIVLNLKAAIRNIENEERTARAFLKFYMGLDPTANIDLTDDIETVLNTLNVDYLLQSNFDVNENIDFLLFLQQKALADLQIKQQKSAYMPTVNAFFSAQANAMRDTYSFFDSKKPWYPTTVWGFQMNIPIWSSGQRHAKVQQSKLNMKKLEENEKQLSSSLNLQVQTARNNFSNKYYEFLNRKKNLEITIRIYQKTHEKYRNGMSSSFDLSQSQNNFIQANTDYTLSIMDLLQNKIELEKILTKTAGLFDNK